MGFQKMSKEEFLWWKEDNKGKFYGLCVGGAALLVVFIFILYSIFKPKPVEEVVEEDVVTEFEVGDFDFEEAEEEQKLSEEEKRTNVFGTSFSFAPYSLQRDEERGGSFVKINRDGEAFLLFIPEGDEGLGSLTDEDWFNLFLDKDIYTLRGKFKDIDSSLVEEWLENDYRNVVLSFSDPEVNAVTAKEWESHLAECKVARDYKKNAKREDIADDDWDSIQKEMYEWFEGYLKSIDEEGNPIPVLEPLPVEGESGEEEVLVTEAASLGTEESKEEAAKEESKEESKEASKEETSEEASEGESQEEEILPFPEISSFLEVYLGNNPLPSYDGILVVDSVPCICRTNGVPYSRINNEMWNNYRSTYWEVFFSGSKEELLNNGDIISQDSKNYAEGVFYHMVKPVEATLQHSYRDRESIVLVRKTDGTKEFYYFPERMWTTDDGDYVNGYYEIPITKETESFAYFMIGESYIVSGSKECAFPILEDPDFKGLNEEDYKVFSINDTICYKRSDVYGNNTKVSVSSFLLEDGPYDIPEGVVYMKNDTKYTITMQEVNALTEYNRFEPGMEIFLDRNYINSITWKVE